MHKLKDSTRQQAIRMLKQGLKNEEICFELRMSKSTLARIRKEYGFPPAKVGRPKQKQEPPKKVRTGSRTTVMPEIKAVKCASGARFA